MKDKTARARKAIQDILNALPDHTPENRKHFMTQCSSDVTEKLIKLCGILESSIAECKGVAEDIDIPETIIVEDLSACNAELNHALLVVASGTAERILMSKSASRLNQEASDRAYLGLYHCIIFRFFSGIFSGCCASFVWIQTCNTIVRICFFS